jgi:hypothetical protein
MKNKKVMVPNMFRTHGGMGTCARRQKMPAKGLLTGEFSVVFWLSVQPRAAGNFPLRDRPLADLGAGVRPGGRARPWCEVFGSLFMEKLAHSLTIRMTQREFERLHELMQQVGADRSSITRLALKRLFRKPPQRRFRFRAKRGSWL